MPAIVSLGFAADAAAKRPWDRIATEAGRWLLLQSIDRRDAIVIVPYAQLLPLARQAFASLGGWMPRVETTGTLAASLGPMLPSPSGPPSFDPVLDGLVAESLLRGEGWAPSGRGATLPASNAPCAFWCRRRTSWHGRHRRRPPRRGRNG